MLSIYTSPDAVRAALGISKSEMKDETLGLQLYDDILTTELRDVSTSVPSTFATVSATASRTDVQEDFLIAARTFATYAVARALTPSLPQFAPKSIEDGKARMERFNDPYKEVIKRVESEYDRWRSKLQAALNAINVTTVTTAPRTFFAAAPAGSNPVTGE